jgi:hypothetical protein
MENSNTCLKEPLLIQRQRHSQEEYDENEYWENHANGIVEHAKNEKIDGNTFLRASLNDMNVLAGRYLITLVSHPVAHICCVCIPFSYLFNNHVHNLNFMHKVHCKAYVNQHMLMLFNFVCLKMHHIFLTTLTMIFIQGKAQMR